MSRNPSRRSPPKIECDARVQFPQDIEFDIQDTMTVIESSNRAVQREKAELYSVPESARHTDVVCLLLVLSVDEE